MLKKPCPPNHPISLLNPYLKYLSLVEQLAHATDSQPLSLEEFETSLLPTLNSEECGWLGIEPSIR